MSTVPAVDSPRYGEWAERRARAMFAAETVVRREADEFTVLDEKYKDSPAGPEMRVWRDASGRVCCNCPAFLDSDGGDPKFRCEHIYLVKFWLERERARAEGKLTSSEAEEVVREMPAEASDGEVHETLEQAAARLAAERASEPIAASAEPEPEPAKEVDSDPLGYLKRNDERRDKKGRALAANGNVSRVEPDEKDARGGFAIKLGGKGSRVQRVWRGADQKAECSCSDFQNAKERGDTFKCEHLLAVKYYLAPPVDETPEAAPEPVAEEAAPDPRVPPSAPDLGPLPPVTDKPARIVSMSVYGPAPRVEARETERGTALVRVVYELEVPLVSVGHLAFTFATLPEG